MDESAYKLNDVLNSKTMNQHVLIFDSMDEKALQFLSNQISHRTTLVEILGNVKNDTFSNYTYISKEELQQIFDLYRTYEFTDKITVISDTNQYGSIFDFYKNGILTEEEVLAALLHG